MGRKDSIFNGALFGYFLFLVYNILGYKGTQESSAIFKFILFKVAFSLVGAIAEVIEALAGNFFKRQNNIKKREIK